LTIELAACMHCFPMYSVERTIQIVAELGFKGIELSGVRPHINPEDYTKDDLKRLRSLLDSEGLKVVGLHTDDGSPHTSTLVHENERARRWKINHLKTCAEVASQLGAGLVTTTAGYSWTIGTPKEKAWQWVKQGLQEASKSCADYGVVIALEPCPGTVVIDSRDGIKMLDDVSSDNVRLLLDTGHAMISFHNTWKESGPHPVDAILESKKYLAYVHADDNNGMLDEHLVPGTGVIDFEDVVKALRQIGYEGYVSFELGTRDPRRGFKDSKKHLEQFLKS